MKRDTLGTLRARIAELEAERQMDRQRLWDLVRLERHSLFESDAITPEEFSLLAQDHPAVARLESYDECRQRLSEWRQRAEVAEAALRKLADADGPHCCLLDDEGNVLIQHPCTCWRNDARVALEGQTNAKSR